MKSEKGLGFCLFLVCRSAASQAQPRFLALCAMRPAIAASALGVLLANSLGTLLAFAFAWLVMQCHCICSNS